MSYRIEMTETAEAELEAAYFWYLQTSPEKADRWYTELLETVQTLAEMPRRCALAPEHENYREEVRQLLYGRGRSTYRILFRIVTTDEEEEGLVRVLHVYHGAQLGGRQRLQENEES